MWQPCSGPPTRTRPARGPAGPGVKAAAWRAAGGGRQRTPHPRNVCQQVQGTDAGTSWRRRAVAGPGQRRARQRAHSRTRPGPGRPRPDHDSDGEAVICSRTAYEHLASAASFSRPCEGAPCKPLVTLPCACTLVGKSCNEPVALASCFPHGGGFQPCCCTLLQHPCPTQIILVLWSLQ